MRPTGGRVLSSSTVVRVRAPIPIGARIVRSRTCGTQTRPGVCALNDLIAHDDAGSDGATLSGGPQISLSEDIEHYDGNFIIHAE